MFQIDLKSRKAIYEQIMDNYKRLISTGALREDEKIPSVRDLAKELTVNPNTIQKAYRELERQGYFYTVLGQGSFAAARPKDSNRREIEGPYTRMGEIVWELLFYGEQGEKIIEVIQSEISNGGSNDPD